MSEYPLLVLLSVDWEPDHGPWKSSEQSVEYDGILKATPVLERLLDELSIPFTWFVETSREKERCTTTVFPEIVRRLTERPADEIGLHLHWRNGLKNGRVQYETADSGWVAAQIEHGKAELESTGATPRSFRSGSFLFVERLPSILQVSGFRVDSSVLWERCHRLDESKTRVRRGGRLARARTLARRHLSTVPAPYFTDLTSVEKPGTSEILEIPVFSGLLELSSTFRSMAYRSQVRRARRQRGIRCVTLFFHIDELTVWSDQDRRQKRVNDDLVEKLRSHILELRRQGAVFCTFQEARKTIEAG